MWANTHKHTLLSGVIAVLLAWAGSPKHPIFTGNIQNSRSSFCAGLMKHSGQLALTYPYIFSLSPPTPSDTNNFHFQNNFHAVTCHKFTATTEAVKATILGLIVQFCGRWRGIWIFPITLPWCNLRIPADVHNASFRSQRKRDLQSSKDKEEERSAVMEMSSRLSGGESRRRK